MPRTNCIDCGVEISYSKRDDAPERCFKCVAKEKRKKEREERKIKQEQLNVKAAQGEIKNISVSENEEEKKFFKRSGYETKK